MHPVAHDRSAVTGPPEPASVRGAPPAGGTRGPQRPDQCTGRDAAQGAVVLGGPQLRRAVGRLVVEDAVRAEVVAALVVGRLPQVRGLVRVPRLVRLLALEAGAGQVSVEQPGGDRV